MNIYSVIVTYNRLNKLKVCLDTYKNQSRKPNKIIVVDNASKEDTKEYLKEWKSIDDGFEKIVLTLDKNYAGGGGFLLFYVQPTKQNSVRKALSDLMEVPFQFENSGTRVSYYSPEIFDKDSCIEGK